MSRGLRLAAAATFLVAVAVTPSGASADEGVRLDLGAVTVERALVAGETYRLPVIGVSNPGTEQTDYRMGVGSVREQAERPVDPAWVTFEPSTFSLAPGQVQAVEVRLVLPPNVASASYAGLLRAEIVGSADTPIAVGAAAAARLSFVVQPSGWVEAWANALGSWLAATSPWPAVILAVAAALLVWRRVRRRWRFTLERRV